MAEKAFVGQQDGEEIQLVLRRHHSVMARGLAMAGLVLVISAAPPLVWKLQWLWLVFLAGLLLAVIIAFNTWIKWYYGVYIVTNRRVRQQIQRGLFHKTTIDVYLDKVQNISYNISGLKGSLLGYGTILLRTMAGDMMMTKIANCEEVYNQLSQIAQTTNDNYEQDENDQKDWRQEP